ncbi:hypothetical protein DFH08DRAFT_1031689 [Mycena albidolilacea]|uniref:Uncharacterized protein n=1 Tax=Mycena albidolilacea TaxID=1033008 RepID=A0AAD7F030_9AGAR|nr:hypothetical protein DFH08DRAFT_1031689 [Mycena albidolilacea]
MEVVSQSSLNDQLDLTFTLSSALIETVSLSTSLSASLFTSNGQAETTSIPITLTFASLVPYLPSIATDPPSATPTSPKSSLPILPIAAAGGGGLAFVILGVGVCLLCRRRRRQRAALRRLTTLKGLPDLDSELPRGEIPGSRTFSRLTYSAPYVVPQSAGTLSIAAPSTVSIGQQYRTVRGPGR